MIHIAVVEDDVSYAKQLIDYLNRYQQESGEVLKISAFSDGFEILENYKSEYDIILLDVQMPFIDGMSAAEEIRKTDPEVVIIFITNMAQYAIRGYAVDALDYVLKPVSYFSFSQRLEKAISRMKKRTTHYITIPVKREARKIDTSTIYYIESRDHDMIYHTSFGEIISSGTMNDIESKLEALHFFRGNKGYLINLGHVSAVRDGCAIVNGETLLLSRTRKNAFMEALAGYVGKVMK